MKSLEDFLNESFIQEAEETIKSEEDFREFAKKKFEEVFGDKLDKERMENTIQGILDDNKKSIEDGDWGTLVGILNKSFGD